MKSKYLLILVLLLVLCSSFVKAGEPPAVEPHANDLLKIGVNLNNIVFPTLNLELQNKSIGITYDYGRFPYEIDDLSVEGKLHKFGGKYYLPLGYEDNSFFVGGGLLKTNLEYDESWIRTTGYHLTGGFEQCSSPRISWGGSIDYMYFPADEIDNKLLFAINVKYTTPVSVNSGRYAGDNSGSGGSNIGNIPEKIIASGSIDRVSHPMDVSGEWKLKVDFKKDRAYLSLSGESDEGPFSYSCSARPRYTGSGVRFSIKDDFKNDGKNVKGQANITITKHSFRASVRLRREDGVTAGAYIRGKTTEYTEKDGNE